MSREKKISIAKALATQLHVTEEAIDTAMAEAANLIEAYVTSRRAIRMSPMIGNEVHQNTLKAMLALNTAQQYMTAAHDNLTQVQQQVGLGGVAIMPATDKPSRGGVSDNEPVAPPHNEMAAE